MTFFIKQNSTFPILEFPLTEQLMEKYDITKEMMENVGVTFSLFDVSNDCYIVANKEADLKIDEDDSLETLDETEYTLQYCFTLEDTENSGVFLGEFKLDFLDNCKKISLPNDGHIDVIIGSSKTKTTVV